jgi:hypothetical protein
MSSYEDRQRVMREIRERAAQVATAHTMSDDESELALLGLGLDDHQAALEKLADTDPVGFIAFADRPGWVESRLSWNTPNGPAA